MHGMTWRWLPIGDSFVDFVASRDTDAWISKRELDSVKVWMESNTVFHVMRGNKLHFVDKDRLCKHQTIINFEKLTDHHQKMTKITITQKKPQTNSRSHKTLKKKQKFPFHFDSI